MAVSAKRAGPQSGIGQRLRRAANALAEQRQSASTGSSTVSRRREAKGMSERAPMSKAMVDTWRSMFLGIWPEGHGGWQLFGYIDWLEEQLDAGDVGDTSVWRERFGHPDA